MRPRRALAGLRRRLADARWRAAAALVPVAAARRGLATALLGPLQPPVPAGRLVLICHCHYLDLVPELARHFRALPRGAELHVSSSDPAVLAAWGRRWRDPARPLGLHLVENRGRDLLPFFTVASGLALAPGAVVLKVHGKRSGYSPAGQRWRRDTLNGLLPGPLAAARTLRRFAAEPRLALLGAPGSVVSHPAYWGGNRAAAAALMRRMAGAEPAEGDLAFVAGTMFFARGAFLSALLPHVDPGAFEPEPIGQDGTYAHAVERAIGMAALAWGWHIGEAGRPGPLTPDAVRGRTVRYI